MSCIRRPCMVFMAGPSRLEPDTGQEFAESGAISVFVTAAGRVLGCEHRAGDGEAPHPDSRQIRVPGDGAKRVCSGPEWYRLHLHRRRRTGQGTGVNIHPVYAE